MRSIGSVFLAIAVFFIQGCNVVTMCNAGSVRGSGVEKTEQRSTGDFSAVDVSGACDVRITCGESTTVKVSGDDNIVPLITTEVKGGVLHISHEGSISPKTDLVITITTPDVRAVSSSGASNVTVNNLRNDQFTLDVSGAGSFEAEGQTGVLTIDVSGATDIQTKNLVARKVVIDVSGASNAEVFAADELTAEVSGVGNVTYHGNPPVVQQEVSGVGSISKK